MENTVTIPLVHPPPTVIQYEEKYRYVSVTFEEFCSFLRVVQLIVCIAQYVDVEQQRKIDYPERGQAWKLHLIRIICGQKVVTVTCP